MISKEDVQVPEAKNIQIKLKEYDTNIPDSNFDFDKIIYDLDSEIDLLSSQADKYDYLVSIGSGILSGLLDIIWVGEFSLERGRGIASDKVDDFVINTAKMLGCESDDLQSAVRFLEDKFPIPSDGNTAELGGSLQHHLRDFAHHPTLAGLMFSLLTQFTYKSYGTDTEGNFKIVNVPERSKLFIGNDIPSKLIKGTFVWFFHLVSDMAGSRSTAGLSGGTGIPGPILSLAKELSVLPIFKNISIGDQSLSVFLSKLFNGTLLAKRDEAGNIIKGEELRFDLRGELGLGIEIGRQAIPVVANECFVRGFYFIRRFAMEVKDHEINSIGDLKKIDWNKVKPYSNPTLSRMLTISTGVFTTLDIGEALITKKYWISVNYIGVGRFLVAIGSDVSWGLKARDVKKIKKMYMDIQESVYEKRDDNLNRRIGEDMMDNNFGLTVEQTEILYNIEYYKTLNDIKESKSVKKRSDIKILKHAWLSEWKRYMTKGFSSFLQLEDATLHWYTEKELLRKIKENNPNEIWFRLVLLEAMLFEPYFPLATEQDKKGREKPSKKYKTIQGSLNGFNKNNGDDFFDSFFQGDYYPEGYVKRLRKTHKKVMFELNEVRKSVFKTVSITSIATVIAVASAGVLAPKIAVFLVGSNFTGLSGAALTAASLAYIGGGAIAAGGAGMAGGTMVIVGGGAILGLGVGASVGGTAGMLGLLGKQNTINQSAKLLVTVREIFLNDEHDTDYSNTVYEKYVHKIMEIEKGLIDLKLQADELTGEEKKKLENEIKSSEESVKAMKIAKDSMKKFISSFEVGAAQ